MLLEWHHINSQFIQFGSIQLVFHMASLEALTQTS